MLICAHVRKKRTQRERETLLYYIGTYSAAHLQIVQIMMHCKRETALDGPRDILQKGSVRGHICLYMKPPPVSLAGTVCERTIARVGSSMKYSSRCILPSRLTEGRGSEATHLGCGYSTPTPHACECVSPWVWAQATEAKTEAENEGNLWKSHKVLILFQPPFYRRY